MVLHEALGRQVEETMDTLAEGPEGLLQVSKFLFAEAPSLGVADFLCLL
jgi:hypothetical protein